MERVRRLIAWLDRWQRGHKVPGVFYAVIKKFGNDNANLLVVSLAWYGFTAIFPLLLVVTTILGFIGAESLGGDIVSTLHKFPVIGDSFNPGSGDQLKGNAFGLIVGLLGLLYGAQGVTQTAQVAMSSVWNVPTTERPSFAVRLGRSLAGLAIIGGAFLINASATTYVTNPGQSYAIRVPALAVLLVLNVGLYWAAFIVLTPAVVGSKRSLLPGAIAGGIAFTVLITVGTGLLTHQLANASKTYGTFGGVIGIVTILLLLAKVSMYAAELNPVLERKLYPRALPTGEPTDADHRVEYELIQGQRITDEPVIAVGFEPDATEEAVQDAKRS
jgi:uncharacterized BrkB/YihY/UPF0761 family membrane protein